MTTVPITRRLEFDTAHRIAKHESKCRAIHGHRYVAEITVQGTELDEAGRVIDFGKVKELVGGWIDDHWDHTAIFEEGDDDPAVLAISETNAAIGRPVYWLAGPPTAENMVVELASQAADLLAAHNIVVVRVRLYETPNCYAEWAW